MPEETEYLPTGSTPKSNLDQIEEKMESIEEKMGMGIKDAVEVENLSKDLVNQMKNASMSTMFKFFIGDKVKNRHDEIGYVELCGLDFRGDIYLVHFKENNSRWYTPMELTLVDQKLPYEKEKEAEPQKKSDFPTELPPPDTDL